MDNIDFTGDIAQVENEITPVGLPLIDKASIRKGKLDGTLVASVIDVTKAITGKDHKGASAVVLNLSEELSQKIRHLRINGKGRETPVADIPTLVEIIWELPGKAAKKFRRTSAKYIVRILGGDPALVDEIKAQDAMLQSTEAGRQMQAQALASVGRKRPSPDYEAEFAMRERKVRVEAMEREEAKAALEHKLWMKEFMQEQGVWNEQMEKLQKSQFVDMFYYGEEKPQMLLTSSSSDCDCCNRPCKLPVNMWMGTHMPKAKKPKDNYSSLGAIVATLFRMRYRKSDDNTHLQKKFDTEQYRKKLFSEGVVSRDGDGDIPGAKLYENEDHDLMRKGYELSAGGMSCKEIKASIRKLGWNAWDKALNGTVEEFAQFCKSTLCQ